MLPAQRLYVLTCYFLATSVARPLEHALASRAAADPTVTISAGVVVGTATQYPGTRSSNAEFLGIPFARSPPERFGLPEPAEAWPDPLPAQQYAPACIQFDDTVSALNPALLNGQSEDCLYANVFVPPNTTSGSRKTVMFWIYGGNLQNGGSSISIYDGSSFAANQDVIVVTFNYRLNGMFSAAVKSDAYLLEDSLWVFECSRHPGC